MEIINDTPVDIQFGPVSATTLSQVTHNNKAVNVTNTVVYTDYANIKLTFVCGHIPGASGLFTGFVISVRDQGFSNLALFDYAVERLKAADATQHTIDYIYQGPYCDLKPPTTPP